MEEIPREISVGANSVRSLQVLLQLRLCRMPLESPQQVRFPLISPWEKSPRCGGSPPVLECGPEETGHGKNYEM